MKNLFVYIGVALIIAATIIGQFTGLSVAKYIELSGFAVGLASCVLGIVSKTSKKDWKLYVSIIGVIAGSVILVFANITESQITALITAVAGLVVLIASLIPALVKKQE